MIHCGTTEMRTERLLLRPFRAEDRDALWELYQDREEQEPAYTVVETLEQTEKYIGFHIQMYSTVPSFYSWAVCLEGTIIGTIGLFPVNDADESCEIGYRIGRTWRGQGYATEAARCVTDLAFRTLRVHRVYGSCRRDIPASARVMEKTGMRLEGTLREFRRCPDGTYATVLCYGMLREDFLRSRGVQVRPLGPGEGDRAVAFYWDMIDAMPDTEDLPRWKKGIYPKESFLRASVEAGELHAAEENGEILGAMVCNGTGSSGCAGTLWPSGAPDDRCLVVHALGVHASRAREGIGKLLVQHAAGLAKERGLAAVRLDVLSGNDPAERLYRGQGFQYVRTVNMYYEDTGWHDFKLFELPVSSS